MAHWLLLIGGQIRQSLVWERAMPNPWPCGVGRKQEGLEMGVREIHLPRVEFLSCQLDTTARLPDLLPGTPPKGPQPQLTKF